MGEAYFSTWITRYEEKRVISLMFGRVKTRPFLRIFYIPKIKWNCIFLLSWAFASHYYFFDHWACEQCTIVSNIRRTLGMHLENNNSFFCKEKMCNVFTLSFRNSLTLSTYSFVGGFNLQPTFARCHFYIKWNNGINGNVIIL